MKKYVALFALAGLIAGLSGTAGAVGFRYDYEGPVTMKFTNWDMGVVYAPPGGLVDGVGLVNGLGGTLYPAANGVYYDTNGVPCQPNALLCEDTWGILKLTRIYPTGGDPDDDVLWLPGDNGVELTGMFYGGVDNAVAPSPFPIGSEFIQTQDVTFDLFENPQGTFGAAGGAHQGSAGRTGGATYTGITGGTLIFSALSMPGVGAVGVTGPDEFVGVFKPDATLTTGSGTFSSYAELDAATALLQRDYDQFNTNGVTAFNYDLTVQGTTIPNDGSQSGGVITGDWTVLSEDPWRGGVIPEPITLVAVGLAISGLGGYIRKRRTA